jgi:hypothetical protein
MLRQHTSFPELLVVLCIILLGIWAGLAPSSAALRLTCIGVSVFSNKAAVALCESISTRPPLSSPHRPASNKCPAHMSCNYHSQMVPTLTFPSSKFLSRLVREHTWPASCVTGLAGSCLNRIRNQPCRSRKPRLWPRGSAALTMRHLFSLKSWH